MTSLSVFVLHRKAFEKTIILSNSGSYVIFSRNRPVFSAEYWFYKTVFDLLFCDEYNERYSSSKKIP